jgi:hypothetical protein
MAFSLTISAVSAENVKKTGKIYFKNGKFVTKKVGLGDYVNIYYSTKRSGGQGFYSANQMHISLTGKNEAFKTKYYKLDKATIQFTKKVNGKTLYSTKTFKPTIDDWGSKTINYHPKNGYKPSYAIITYKNK